MEGMVEKLRQRWPLRLRILISIALFLAVLNVWRLGNRHLGSARWFWERNDFRLSGAIVFSLGTSEAPAALRRFDELGAYHICCRPDQLEEARRLFPEVQTILVLDNPREQGFGYTAWPYY
jgi:hypothetical protein